MKCTHIALQVRDQQRSARFYGRYCGMKIVHERETDDGRVIWLGWGEDPPKFVIVLLHGDYEQNTQPPWQHLGMAVESRAEVDAAYQQAQSDGVDKLWPPTDAGPVVGYYCGISDPDGNRIEFWEPPTREQADGPTG